MFRDKTIIFLLLSYLLFQLGALSLGEAFFLLIYLILYIIAMIHSIIKISKSSSQSQILKETSHQLLWYFVSNLILYLIYLPTLVYNPEINWTLKGQNGQDPVILQAYVPIVLFIISVVTIGLAVIVIKIVLSNKSKNNLSRERKEPTS